MKRLNALLILAALAVGLLNVGILLTPAATLAGSASFYASPSSGSYHIGDAIRVAIMINSGGQAINAGEATVTWSSGLQYSFASTSGSIFTTWASGGGAGPVGSANSVYFSGGLANPGYNGGGGRVVTVIFNATQPGTFNVNVAGSQILANDGQGTNVLCCSSGATFTVQAAAPTLPLLTVVSSSHPDQGKWYNNTNVQLNWYATAAVPNYSYSFDQNPTGNPTTPNNATTQTTEQGHDGTWYFHLKGTNAAGSSVVNFAIHIDTKPPDPFQISFDNKGNVSNPTPVANFGASDGTSGIDHYTASVDGGASFAINPGDALPKQHPGKHTLKVTAYDKAGNSTTASADFSVGGITPPKILVWPKTVLILEPMDFIGQSEPGDTINVYLNGKLLESFLASSKKAPKAKDQGSGGFDKGITWEYVYHPQLFPGDYKVYFSRVNSVGAESSPTPDYKIKINASASVTLLHALWMARYILLAIIIIEPFLQSLLYLILRKRGWLPEDSTIFRKLANWRPFSWAKVKSPKPKRRRGNKVHKSIEPVSAPIETAKPEPEQIDDQSGSSETPS